MKRAMAALTTTGTAVLLALAAPVESQPVAAQSALTYADLADVALGTPLAVHVRVRDAVALKAERAVGVAPGMARLYVDAEVVSLLRAERGLASRISYLVDVPLDSRGRAPKLRRGEEYLLFGRSIPNRPGEIQLASPRAQLRYTPAAADMLREILREANQAGAPPQIVGIGKAFHVPGSLPGESETQVFLQTADQRPISLSIMRRPGEEPRWVAALSEIVDDTAAPPAPNTLLWYRLACTLPRSLPAASLSEAQPSHAEKIAADYRLVLDRLGPCARSGS